MEDNEYGTIQVTRSEAISIGLKIRNAHMAPAYILTAREMECLTEIILFGLGDDTKSLSPYTGVGRIRICESLNISTNQYSRILGILSKKDVLYNLGQRGSYMLSPLLSEFFDMDVLRKGGVFGIKTLYEIIDEEHPAKILLSS